MGRAGFSSLFICLFDLNRAKLIYIFRVKDILDHVVQISLFFNPCASETGMSQFYYSIKIFLRF